jgi:hypothetical protein
MALPMVVGRFAVVRRRARLAYRQRPWRGNPAVGRGSATRHRGDRGAHEVASISSSANTARSPRFARLDHAAVVERKERRAPLCHAVDGLLDADRGLVAPSVVITRRSLAPQNI